jgi:hypothetical protein
LINELSQLSGLGQAVIRAGEVAAAAGKFILKKQSACPPADNPVIKRQNHNKKNDNRALLF